MYSALQVSVDNLVQLIGVMDKHLLDTANLSLTSASVSYIPSSNLLFWNKQYLPSKGIELWNLVQIQVNMKNGSINNNIILKFVICYHFQLCHFKAFDDYVTLHTVDAGF